MPRSRQRSQLKLLDLPQSLPNGLVYLPDFLSPEEESILLEGMRLLPFRHAPYGEYLARRRIVGLDLRDKGQSGDNPAFRACLKTIVSRIAKWLDISPERVAHALFTEYRPGTPLGWHRDQEECEHIVGLSLAGWSHIQFRPHPLYGDKREKTITLELEPCSAYIMQREIRWKWQHHIPAVKNLRYSITFRTLSHM